MTTNLNQLPINEVLTKADQAKDRYITERKEFYLILGYLDQTKRYKEDKQYKGASFDTFLRTRYNMTFKKYSKNKIVLFDYSEDAEKHGEGFVGKVLERAGRAKARAVLDEIDETQSKRKTPLKVADKEKVLEKYIIPKPEITKREQPRHDWEFAFKQEHRRAEGLQAELAELKDQNKKLIARNAELSNLVAALQEELDAKEKQVKAMRQHGGFASMARHTSEYRPSA